MSNLSRPAVLMAVVVVASLATACNRVMLPPEELAARVIMSQCPPGLPAPSVNEDPPLASLTVNVRVEPAVSPTTEVRLTLDGDANKTVLTMNAGEATQLTLKRGAYLIRAAIPGYVPIEGRAPLTAGCSATLTLVLKKPAILK